MSGHAHGLAISSVQLGITGFWAQLPVSSRRCGLLCIYVLLVLYTKHKHTKASSMPVWIRICGIELGYEFYMEVKWLLLMKYKLTN